MNYQDRLETNLLVLFAYTYHIYFRMIFHKFCYRSSLLLNM